MEVPSPTQRLVAELATLSSAAHSRFQLWEAFITAHACRAIAEVGVYRGDFAEHLLRRCPTIETYHMVDPWRNLQGWNKPANKSDEVFDEYFRLATQRTSFAGDRIRVHRGTTLEVIEEIPDGSLDFAYIDGDHTLQGITIDLQHIWGKIRPGGWIAGDDFSRSIWQHDAQYEPSFVFPYTVYFAKAMNVPILAVGHEQFLIWKSGDAGFAFHDLFNGYPSLELREQFLRGPARRSWLRRFL